MQASACVLRQHLSAYHSISISHVVIELKRVVESNFRVQCSINRCSNWRVIFSEVTATYCDGTAGGIQYSSPGGGTVIVKFTYFYCDVTMVSLNMLIPFLAS